MQPERVVRVLESLLPLNGRGECFYCGVGSVPDKDGFHHDTDNLWNGDPLCLKHPFYDEARKLLEDAKKESLP